MINSDIIANVLGVLSLISAIVILLPNIYQSKKQTNNRLPINSKVVYFSLLITLGLGLMHGLLMTQTTTIDYYNFHSYWVYAVGLFSFNLLIFVVLNFRELKADFQQLKYINYALLLLLVCHVGAKLMP